VKVARIRRAIVPLAMLGIVAMCFSGCADEPEPNCIATTAPFAVKLLERDRQESTTGACDAFGPASFNADPEVGLAPFYARDSKGQPDYDKGSLAIQTAEVGKLYFYAQDSGVDNAATDGTVYSLGAFNGSKPDADHFCTAPTMSPTHIVLADVPAVPDDPTTEEDESVPEQPAVDIKLDWSNVKVYVTAASYGTQFAADLTDTRTAADGSTCTITYKAVGLAPAVPCNLLDADGNPLSNDDGTPQLDLSACDPLADPAKGRSIGSGISANTRYECDAATAFCTIAGDTVPAIE